MMSFNNFWLLLEIFMFLFLGVLSLFLYFFLSLFFGLIYVCIFVLALQSYNEIFEIFKIEVFIAVLNLLWVDHLSHFDQIKLLLDYIIE